MYAVVLLLSAAASGVLVRSLVLHGPTSKVARLAPRPAKLAASVALYVAAIPLAFVHPFVSDAIFIALAAVWFVPDRAAEEAAAAEH